jgi:hypothetical protein
MKLDLKRLKNAYFGDRKVSKIYIGSKEVWKSYGSKKNNPNAKKIVFLNAARKQTKFGSSE